MWPAAGDTTGDINRFTEDDSFGDVFNRVQDVLTIKSSESKATHDTVPECFDDELVHVGLADKSGDHKPTK